MKICLIQPPYAKSPEKGGDCFRKELEMLRRMEPPQLTASDYDFISQWKEEAQYNEYRLEKIEELREEVAAWRRKARRVKSV